ncbi:MAG: SpoOJ regulator, partial [uncultured bacterium]
GGTGKTTTAINLSGEISQKGYKVLLIDNDPQSNITKTFNIQNKYTLYDLYYNKQVTFEDCIVKLKDNISIIPNIIQSADLDDELQNRGNRENILKHKLDTLETEFDFIIIDNNPYKSVLLKNALTVSDYYLEVIDNSLDAIEGLKMIERTIKDLKEDRLNDKIKSIGILRSRYDKVTSFSKEFSEVVKLTYKEKLFDAIVYDSVKYKEARAMKKFIQEYSKEHATVYAKMFDEILGRLNIEIKFKV